MYRNFFFKLIFLILFLPVQFHTPPCKLSFKTYQKTLTLNKYYYNNLQNLPTPKTSRRPKYPDAQNLSARKISRRPKSPDTLKNSISRRRKSPRAENLPTPKISPHRKTPDAENLRAPKISRHLKSHDQKSPGASNLPTQKISRRLKSPALSSTTVLSSSVHRSCKKISFLLFGNKSGRSPLFFPKGLFSFFFS